MRWAASVLEMLGGSVIRGAAITLTDTRRLLLVVGLSLFACRVQTAPTGLAKALDSARDSEPSGARDVREFVAPPWARLLAVWGEPGLSHRDVSAAAFIPNARLVTFGGGQLRIWDLKSRSLVKVLEPCPPLEAPEPPALQARLYYPQYFTVAAQGSLVAVGNGHGEICVRRLPDGAIVQHFRADETAIRYLAFADPTRLVSYAHRIPEPPTMVAPQNPCDFARAPCPPPKPDGNLRLWDVKTASLLGQAQLGDSFSNPPLVRSPDGSRLAGVFQGKLKCIDVSTMKVAWLKPGSLRPLAFVTSDRLLVVEPSHDPERKRLLELFAKNGNEGRSMDVLTELAQTSVLDVNERTKIAAVFSHKTLIFWDTAHEERLGSKSSYEWPGASEPISATGGVFSEDGSVLATWSGSKIVLWDVARQEPILKRRGHHTKIHDLDISRDGKRALSTSGDGTVRTWRIADGSELSSWALGPARAAFSPDGSRVLVSVDTTVSVRDAKSGDVVWKVDERSWDAKPIYSEDGFLVATQSQRGGITVHDANTGKKLWHHEQRTSPQLFTPDGKYLVGSLALKMVLFDSRTGERVRQLWDAWTAPRFDRKGRLSFIDINEKKIVRLPVDGSPPELSYGFLWGRPALIAPDGDRVFSAGWDRKVHLLRVGQGPEPEGIDLSVFDDAATHLALSPDGSHLLVGTQHGLILHFAVD